MADQYEFLTKDNISNYLSSKQVFANLIDANNLVEFKEVGDGNLNLVFIMKDSSGKGIVLKQALPYVRLVGPDWPMTPSRARIEAETTIIHSKFAKDLVPEIYDYDPDRFIIAMEDLSDHVVWRGALNLGLRFDGVAGPLGKYVAKTAFGTSIFGLGQENHKLEVSRAINPGLCLITEDLVFTEPYFESGRNSVLPSNEKDAQDLANDKEMVNEIGLLKYKFMTAAESLIHGDLHTGSAMIKCEDKKVAVSVKAIDSEFSFYGPIGFDLGALVANYTIAAARACALGNLDQMHWALSLPEQTWVEFEKEFRNLWPSRVDKRVFTDQLLEELIKTWRADTLGYAGAKMARRIVGLAKTSDIETLEPNVREGAARAVLQVARKTTKERNQAKSWANLAKEAAEIMQKTATK
ncbi:MAG: S-methyl-5-thioribose kinase [Actinobacteria bacterium]|nr:S-methyl-5-thioribose kinase [Actinomycetota bacterium]